MTSALKLTSCQLRVSINADILLTLMLTLMLTLTLPEPLYWACTNFAHTFTYFADLPSEPPEGPILRRGIRAIVE